MGSWRDLWEERGRYYPIDDPAKLDGFDHTAGKLTEVQVSCLVKKIKSSLDLIRRDLLLEAGCGAGMLLQPLSGCVRKAIGVDYAASMVERCRRLFPHLEVLRAEVRDLPFRDNSFDKIVCFSVFQYFPNLKYAEKVLSEFIRVCKPGGGVFIGDVPDEETKEKSLEFRRKQPDENLPWKSSVRGELSHLYYKRSFFRDFLRKRGIKCEIAQQDIPGYGNSPFRFNIVFKRTDA